MEQSMGVCHIAEFQPWPGLAQNGRNAVLSNNSNSSHGDAKGRSIGLGKTSQTKPGAALGTNGAEAAHAQAVPPEERRAPNASAPSRVTQPAPAGQTAQQVRNALDGIGTSQGSGPREPRARPGRGDREGGDESHAEFGEERFDKLDAAISWWVDQGARDPREKGASRASTSSLLCGRIPQQIADLRTNTRELAAHCDSLHVTTSHGRPNLPARDNGPSLERLEAAHATVMDVARRLLEEGGFVGDALDSPSYAGSPTLIRDL